MARIKDEFDEQIEANARVNEERYGSEPREIPRHSTTPFKWDKSSGFSQLVDAKGTPVLWYTSDDNGIHGRPTDEEFIARSCSNHDELVWALDWLTIYDRRGTESHIDAHDRVWRMFEAETGMVSPMDNISQNIPESPLFDEKDHAKRLMVWKKWHEVKKSRAKGALAAARGDA